MLPTEILSDIIDCLPQATMGSLVRISQANRQFRQICLSDRVWAKFDVYDVRHKATLVYKYGRYELSGIVAHFFSHLQEASLYRRGWLLARDARYPSDPHGIHVTSSDLYGQFHALCLIDTWDIWNHIGEDLRHRPIRLEEFLDDLAIDNFPRDIDGIDNLVRCIKPRVCELWSTQMFFVPPEARPDVYEYIPRQFLRNKQVHLALIRTVDIDQVEPCYEYDWDVNISMVLRGIKEPSASFKRNKQFLLYALSAMRRTVPYGWPLQSICGELLSDRDIVLAAAALDGLVLKYVPDKFRGDREIVLAAVKSHRPTLDFASDELRNDADLVLYAMEQSPNNFEYASETLKTNWDFVQRAIKRDARILRWTPLRRDCEFMLMILQNSPELLKCAAPDLIDSEMFVLEALRRDIKLEWPELPWVYENKHVLLKLIEKDGNALKLAPSDLKNDPEIVLAAVRQSPGALQYASPEIRELWRVASERLK